MELQSSDELASTDFWPAVGPRRHGRQQLNCLSHNSALLFLLSSSSSLRLPISADSSATQQAHTDELIRAIEHVTMLELGRQQCGSKIVYRHQNIPYSLPEPLLYGGNNKIRL